MRALRVCADALWTDLRLGVRTLAAARGFVTVVAITFALAIGANVTVFSLFNAIALQSVPGTDAHGLVAIATADSRSSQPGYVYVDTYNAFRAEQKSFSALSLYSGGGVFRLEARRSASDVGVEGVLPEYFDVVNVRPTLGRLLSTDDGAASTNGLAVVVITDRLWRRVFGGDPRVIGETVKINGQIMTVVGVTAAGFLGLQVDGGVDALIPLPVLRTWAGDMRRPIRGSNVVGRLARGVTLARARAEVVARWPAIQADTIPASLSDSERQSLRTARVSVEPLSGGFSGVRRQYGSGFTAALGVTMLLLAVSCVNVSGLMVARAMRRQHDVAVRLALGASRARILQQTFVESVIVAGAGLAVALPLAWWLTRSISTAMSIARTTPFARPMTPDGRVFAAAAAITVLTAALAALAPGWRTARVPLDQSLRQGPRLAAATSRSGRWLLVGQLSLTMILVVLTGLFIETVAGLYANDRSFRRDRILFTRLWREPGDREIRGRAYWQEVVRRLSVARGIESVGLSSYFPAYLGYPGTLPTDLYASPSQPSVSAAALTELVSPGLFDTFQIARLGGRDFTWLDDEHAPAVAIINQALAAKLFQTDDVIGRHLTTGSGATSATMEIVGIVVDVPIGTIREPHQPVVFRPMLQNLPQAQVPLAHARISGLLADARDGYIAAVQSQGHHFVRKLFTIEEWISYAVLEERFVAGASAYAATLAVLLACIGIYGLLAHAAMARTRELGIRLALGATRLNVMRIIVRDGAAVVLAGVTIGAPCSIAAGRLVRSQLYGVAPESASIVAVAATVLSAAGLFAAWLPALRASRLEPLTALRHD